MQPSPLQLDELKFLHIRIEPRIEPDLRNQDAVLERYEFVKTRFNTTIEHMLADDDPESPFANFLVSLRVELPDAGENPPPYIVDVKCVGYFGISKEAFPDPVKRCDVGVVNGSSMLYGAIREKICSITARSWYGQLVLPSVNFASDAPSNGNHIVVPIPDVAKKKSSKSRARKITTTGA